ncbi:AAA family ATPase [Patulibacter defluvii]|uniref:AAA family ATPase n=1 Tax=Patulibacter defluvii TaxID=3095358 RepID=UPI002A75D1B3|nr:helix-turn-helix domain-containing protein [Patulibacter sp. DM4]
MSEPGRQGTPFPFEGPVPPSLMIDRQRELALLARRAADRVNVRLVAPRRFGKTSVTLAHARTLRESGWRTAHVDLFRVADVTDVARRVAAAYAALDVPWIRAHLSGLLARIGVGLSASGPTVTVGPRPPAGHGADAEALLLELLDLPLTLWNRDQTPTLVVFDEFQDLLVARRDLDGLLRSRIQYHQDAAAYVFCGSEPSMMRELFEARARPLFGQATPLTLGPLPLADVAAELAARYGDEGLDPGLALGELVAFAAGHPQRTMLLAYLLAERLADGQPGTPAVAREVIDEAIAQTAAGLRAMWNGLDANERAVLAAIADGVAPSSTALAASHGVARSTLNNAAERLVDQGHLQRDGDRGAIAVVDPLLAEWVRQR